MTTETIILNSPETFAASIPALVGFYPTDSLVVVYLGGKQIIVTMRVDLDDSDEFHDTIGEYVVDTAKKVGADEAIVAIFSHKRTAWSTTDRIKSAAAGRLPLRDSMLIDGGRLYTANGDPEGVVIPESSALEVERIAQGDPPLGESREEIVARYTPHPELGPNPDVMINAMEINSIEPSRRAKRAWETLNTLTRNRSNPGPEYDPLRATLILAVQHTNVRDYVMCHMAKDGNHVELVDTLINVALTAPEGFRKQICAMAAAMMTTLPSCIGVESLIVLAEDESLINVVKAARSVPVPPTALLETFAEAEENTNERLVEEDKKFRIEQKRDPFARQLRKKRNDT